MLVYDVRNINSFESIQTWIRYISRCAPADVEWMILGNMTDLENARKITKKQGETLAAEHSVKFMETSAKTGQGINEAFLVLAQDINDKLDKKPHRETALHFATKNKSHCAVEVLVKNKAFLNSVDADGRTALMFAAENDDFLSLHFLLQAKADTTRRDKCGRTALHCAIEANSLSTADILIANMETAELNSVDNDGRTALMIAIEKADLTSLQMLLKADADIMLKRASDRTVLHYAAELGFHEAVKLLLEWEADINAVDKDGNTPLHIAALNNMPSVVDVLLKSKADADCVNKRGKRPYQLATEVQINSILWEARVSKTGCLALHLYLLSAHALSVFCSLLFYMQLAQ
jgi:ankyrin repeat protein